MQQISYKSIDYLQRSQFSSPMSLHGLPLQQVAPFRPLWHIRGVGQIETETGLTRRRRWQITGEDILVGLYSRQIPVAFLTIYRPSGISIYIGVWSRQYAPAAESTLQNQALVLHAQLQGRYPAIDLVPAAVPSLDFSRAGLAVGIPSLKPTDPQDAAAPLDRLARALSGSIGAHLIVAEPMRKDQVITLRDTTLYESNEVQTYMAQQQAPDPVANHYSDLLHLLLNASTEGQTIGAWRTAVYLLGDARSYDQLAATWTGIFAGSQSTVEPVQIADCDYLSRLASEWSMLDVAGDPGPGRFRHPFQYQSVLTSSQLATYIHLPRLESRGFRIYTLPDFPPAPPPTQDGRQLVLGQLMDHMALIEALCTISFTILKQHGLITGPTGSGKTNCSLGLLDQLAASGVPFVVIEPSKAEYRVLANTDKLRDRVQIFSLGCETISAYRNNPLEPTPGTPVSVHIDLVRSVFAASMGMWTPLPEALDKCLYAVYEDRGWDIVSNTNSRLAPGVYSPVAFPTLADLMHKVEELVPTLGYPPDIEKDICAALLIRLQRLCSGGKGRMLNTQRSVPMDMVLTTPTIFELEQVADDDDKAFIMAMLLVRLVETLRAAGPTKELRVVLVIEEAHRLLSAVERHVRQEEANPRGRAVELFANLIAEMRAFGLSVLVVEQIATKLASEIIKLTNLKIVFPVVDAHDRAVLAGATNMTKAQSKSLATLQVGQAVVFAAGWNSPVHLQIPLFREVQEQECPKHEEIAEYMAHLPVTQQLQALLRPHALCATYCPLSSPGCDAARTVAEEPDFQRTLSRIILSMVEDVEALDRQWPDLLSVVMPKVPPRANEYSFLRCVLIHGANWFTSRRGAQAAWTYSDTEKCARQLCRLLLARLDSAELQPAWLEFQQHFLDLQVRRFQPFAECGQICTQQPPLCLYRYAVADWIASSKGVDDWRKAEERDREAKDESTGAPIRTRHETWQVSLNTALELIETPVEVMEGGGSEEQVEKADAATRRVALCYGCQMMKGELPRIARFTMAQLFREASHE